MTVSLEVLPAAEWAATVAGDLVARLRERPALRLCLPTGETPAPIYAALVELARQGEAPFAGAEVILLDEYLGLPAGDPASGGPRLRRELIDHLDPPPAYHAIDAGAPDLRAEAARHDAVAARGIDLALVGLGLNGHVGLNEPGSNVDAPTRVVTLSGVSRAVATDRYGASVAPQEGITLGIGRLLDAGDIWLLVTGARKADVLERVLHGPETADCPASFLRRHARLRVVADEPAAAALSR